MSHDRLRRPIRIGLGALALLATAPAFAADPAYPYPPQPEPAPSQVFREERIEEQVPPPPQAGPAFDGPRFASPPEECRTIVKRRIDEFGEEVVRGVRICDEAAYPPPRPRYRPSFYDPGPPVPPADIPYEEPRRW